MHWERKSLCDSLYYNIHFITVVWNWTHNTCKLCICMSVSPIWPKVWFKFNISLFIFCMDDISIVEREVLRFFTVVFLSMPHFRFLSVCLKYLGAPVLGAHTFMIWRRIWQLSPVFLPVESHGQRSLTGYSLWGRKSQTWLSD